MNWVPIKMCNKTFCECVEIFEAKKAGKDFVKMIDDFGNIAVFSKTKILELKQIEKENLFKTNNLYKLNGETSGFVLLDTNDVEIVNGFLGGKNDKAN